MLRVIACVALLIAGCAVDPPAPVVQTKTITKIVTVREPQVCEVTERPQTASEFCATVKRCGQIATCAEAYYRLTVCNHRLLDGGTARKKDEQPTKHGEPDGVPCEAELCGRGGATMMAARIRQEFAAGKQPFVLPMTKTRECRPA
jgi:hypothetical protein